MRQLLINIKIEYLIVLILGIPITSCVTGIGYRQSKISLYENELSIIAISSEASDREKFAAEELISYLNKISGKELSVVTIKKSKVPDGAIAIGDIAISSGIISQEELDLIREDGFVINIDSKKGAICGWRDLGTIYEVYELLRQVGIEFFAQDCEIVPERSSLTIPEIKLAIKPHYDLRTIFKYDVYFKGITPNDDLGYHGDLSALEERNWVYSASFMVPCRIFGKDHPEYFALLENEKRFSQVIDLPDICVYRMKKCVKPVPSDYFISLKNRKTDHFSLLHKVMADQIVGASAAIAKLLMQYPVII
mgnify:FL=1